MATTSFHGRARPRIARTVLAKVAGLRRGIHPAQGLSDPLLGAEAFPNRVLIKVPEVVLTFVGLG
eukprot:2367361-Alexandrium_andersonii.AAC.1